jgi:hypothetical protein
MVDPDFQDEVAVILVDMYEFTEEEAARAVKDSIEEYPDLWDDDELDPEDVADIVAKDA